MLSSVLATHRASAQCEPQWLQEGGIIGVAGDISAMLAWDPDGDGELPSVLVVGGSFPHAGNISVSNIAYWDGASWYALGTGFNGRVRVLTVYEGDLVAGGFGEIGVLDGAVVEGELVVAGEAAEADFDAIESECGGHGDGLGIACHAEVPVGDPDFELGQWVGGARGGSGEERGGEGASGGHGCMVVRRVIWGKGARFKGAGFKGAGFMAPVSPLRRCGGRRRRR